MPSPSTSQTELLDLLETGALLLTPTTVAARALRRAFDDRQRARNLNAWNPANVLSWSQFTAGLWSTLIVDGNEGRLLLNSAQEHLLWREVLTTPTRDAAPSALASPDTLADLAASAFQLAAQHLALPRLRASATSPDTRTFATWAEAFLRLLKTRDCLATAQLEEALSTHLTTGTLLPATGALPATLHLVAFADPNPAQQLLITAFTKADVTLTPHTLTQPQQAPPTHYLAADPHAELQFAADTLAQLFTAANPPSSVTLLLPDPAADRAELESGLRATLAPALNHIATDLSSTPWEFAGGTPLASHALIADALSLISLTTGTLTLPRITALLRSPFFGQPAQRDTTARFDASLRKSHKGLRPELDLPTLVHHLESYTRNAADKLPHLTATVPTWPRHLATQLERAPLDPALPRSYSDWLDALRTLLQAANFPPTDDLTPTLFALTQAWDNLLDTAATLDFAGRRIPLSTVLETLARLAETTAFTPPATHAPIQILPYDDAAGTLHETVLVLRATDASLPPRPRPHPLLSWSLQRTLAMPGTDPAHDNDLARTTLHDLLAASGSVVFTSAAEDATGHLRPSPLLADLAIPTEPSTPHHTTVAPILYDLVCDDDALPPPPTDVPGGAKALTLQAACGFRAFAEVRLQATEPGDPAFGLDASASGSLLHDTLHHLWRDLHSQAELKQTSTADRIVRIDRAIAQALKRHHIGPNSTWDAAYTRLVTLRLRNLLLDWLALEEQRGPFEIYDLETKQEVTVGPLTFNVRVDRIDTVSDADGKGVLFVDYKTGASANPKHWDTARPEDPQLPLYALLSLSDPAQVKGLTFARVRTGDMRYHGIHTEAGILPKSDIRDIPTLLEEWHATLAQLAHDFYLGDVRVNPNNYPTTCNYCGQRLLCRLDPTTLHQPDETTEAI